MLRLIGRRLLISLPLLFIISILTFVLLRLVPGDAAVQLLGIRGSPEQLAALRHTLGLDVDFVTQYTRWLGDLSRGSLGKSLFGFGPVLELLNSRFAVTIAIVSLTVLTTALFGILLGVASAVRGGLLGRSIDFLALLAFGIPGFYLASLLVASFAVAIPIFPATGYVKPQDSIVEWLRSLALPVITLSILGIAVIAKQTRDQMLDVLNRGFIRNLRAAGVSERSIIWKHGLRNASLPLITILGLQVVGLMGGATIVENVFGLPGVGSLVVLAAGRHDIPVIQGVALYFTLIVVAVNLLLDIAYGWLNPKVRVS